jgi:hypothetical protein
MRNSGATWRIWVCGEVRDDETAAAVPIMHRGGRNCNRFRAQSAGMGEGCRMDEGDAGEPPIQVLSQRFVAIRPDGGGRLAIRHGCSRMPELAATERRGTLRENLSTLTTPVEPK